MTKDARFEDGAEAALALRAETPDDLTVLSALVQDAVLPITEIRWDRRARRLSLLINRFRWEDRAAAERAGRGFERVRAMLLVRDVMAVRTQGIDRAAGDRVLSLLDIQFEAGAECGGRVIFTLAEGAAIALEVEALDLTLRDVTRPYLAPSGRAPKHD